MGEGWYCTPVWRGEEGEDGGEVDVAKEEIEREESKSYHVLQLKLHEHIRGKLYLEWPPTSDVFEYVIKVLYDFTILSIHDCCLSLSFSFEVRI